MAGSPERRNIIWQGSCTFIQPVQLSLAIMYGSMSEYMYEAVHYIYSPMAEPCPRADALASLSKTSNGMPLLRRNWARNSPPIPAPTISTCGARYAMVSQVYTWARSLAVRNSKQSPTLNPPYLDTQHDAYSFSLRLLPSALYNDINDSLVLLCDHICCSLRPDRFLPSAPIRTLEHRHPATAA